MNDISERVKELRELADGVNYTMNDWNLYMKALRDAANTIEDLSKAADGERADKFRGLLIDGDKLFGTIEENSYFVQYGRNSLERGMTLTGIKQAIEEQQAENNGWIPWGDGKITDTAYRRIVEKHIQKRPLKYEIHEDRDLGICPYCRKTVYDTYNYCPQCGQSIEWTRP